MPHFAEFIQGRTASALCRRIGGNKFWMGCLQFFEFVHQLVKFIIADDGRVECVVKVVVIIYLLTEFFNLLAYIRITHTLPLKVIKALHPNASPSSQCSR